MSFLRSVRDSDPDLGSIDLPEFGSFKSPYTEFAATEESPEVWHQTFSRPLISRKPVSGSPPIYFQAERTNSNISPRERPRMLQQHSFRNTILGLLLGGLTMPFFLYGSYAWHMHNEIVKSQSEWAMLNDFGKKVGKLSWDPHSTLLTNS